MTTRAAGTDAPHTRRISMQNSTRRSDVFRILLLIEEKGISAYRHSYLA